LEVWVVASADDAVADSELVLADLERLGAEAAGSDKQCPGCVVEVGDVVSAVGEHDCSAEVVLGGLPPVLEQALFGHRRVVGELKATVACGVGEVGLGVAVA
jgi:hypothetical protein